MVDVEVLIVDKDGTVEEASDIGQLLLVLGEVLDLFEDGILDVLELGRLFEGVGGGANGVERADTVHESHMLSIPPMALTLLKISHWMRRSM